MTPFNICFTENGNAFFRGSRGTTVRHPGITIGCATRLGTNGNILVKHADEACRTVPKPIARFSVHFYRWVQQLPTFKCIDARRAETARRACGLKGIAFRNAQIEEFPLSQDGAMSRRGVTKILSVDERTKSNTRSINNFLIDKPTKRTRITSINLIIDVTGQDFARFAYSIWLRHEWNAVSRVEGSTILCKRNTLHLARAILEHKTALITATEFPGCLARRRACTTTRIDARSALTTCSCGQNTTG